MYVLCTLTEGNSEIEIKLKIPFSTVILYATTFVLYECLQIANMKKAKHKVTSRKKFAMPAELYSLNFRLPHDHI